MNPLTDNPNVFAYDDGSGTITYADPFDIERDLRKTLMADPSAVIARANAKDDGAFDAQAELVNGIRAAFKLVPFDRKTGIGATASHALRVWDRWVLWCEKKNQPVASSPTSPAPTDSPAIS